MKIETQRLEDHQVKLTVEADADQLESAKRRAARALAKRLKIPGFRPGKAPYHIVERTAGEEAIFEDAVELLANDLYPQALKESGIQPYGPGQLEGIPSREPLVFEFVVPLEAEVELGDYRSIREPYQLEPVPQSEVDEVLENMRQQQAVLEPVERPAEEGDQVQIRLRGERKHVEEGESNQLVREMPVPVIIDREDAQDLEEWPFPGFSRQLIGLSAGDEKTLPYTFPEDSQYETLRGAEAEFFVKVEDVKKRTLPELDDDFALSQGEYESLEALINEIRSRLEQRNRDAYEETYDEKILDQVIESSTIKYPPQMLENEVGSVVHDLEHRLQRQNMDIETYLKTRQIDRAALEEELRPVAESRLKRLLVLFELGREEDVQVKNEEVQAEAINTLNQYYGSMPPDQAPRELSRDALSNLTNSIMADLMVKNTQARLRAIAKGEAEAEAQAAPAEETIEETKEDVETTGLPEEEIPAAAGEDAPPAAAEPPAEG